MFYCNHNLLFHDFPVLLCEGDEEESADDNETIKVHRRQAILALLLSDASLSSLIARASVTLLSLPDAAVCAKG